MSPPGRIGDWLQRSLPVSQWRRRARLVMVDIVEALRVMSPELLTSNSEVLIRIDAAYPFGERRYHPYRSWLAERRLLIEALTASPAPSRDEAEVCSVARDELELHPERADEVRAMLDEQAPHRLGRRCPACDAKPGRPCREFLYEDPPVWGYGQYPTGEELLIVPHEARLVGHLGAGPLFEARS